MRIICCWLSGDEFLNTEIDNREVNPEKQNKSRTAAVTETQRELFDVSHVEIQLSGKHLKYPRDVFVVSKKSVTTLESPTLTPGHGQMSPT